jgi:hypothetical protein
MSLNLSQLTVPVFVRGLTVLSTLLKKAEEHVLQAGVAPETLIGARLASDMLPLSGQVQRASDTSKFAVQRLSGGTAPKFADDETTFAQLQERIAKTIAYLESVDASLIDAGSTRDVAVQWGPTTTSFTAPSYVLTMALPNFYFHVATAHGILRSQGVQIGKLDYLGPFNG